MDTTITLRTNSAVKKAAQRRAKNLGVSLSDVLNNSLRRFASGKDKDYDEAYSDEYIAELLAASEEAMNDHEAGKLESFTPDEFISHLKSITKK